MGGTRTVNHVIHSQVTYPLDHDTSSTTDSDEDTDEHDTAAAPTLGVPVAPDVCRHIEGVCRFDRNTIMTLARGGQLCPGEIPARYKLSTFKLWNSGENKKSV